MLETNVNYGRKAIVRLVLDVNCSFCGENKSKAIGWDNSNGEYGLVIICKRCIDNEFGY